MYVLHNSWEDDYLDFALGSGQSRLAVSLWQNIAPIENAFIQRERDWRLIYNYLREIGPRAVWRKVRSRTAEKLRNEKYVSCGIGSVLETAGQTFSPGDRVVFLAPFHPRCVDRVVLTDSFIRKVELSADDLERLLPPEDGVMYRPRTTCESFPSGWERWAGWSEHAGIPTDHRAPQELLKAIGQALIADGSEGQFLPIAPRVTREQLGAQSEDGAHGLHGVLFGLGNYAKTALLPNLDPRIRVVNVHEIDPTQLGRIDSPAWSADTSPSPRTGEKADVYLIAGFHHTHAELAVHALRSGAVAVVEKPLATTRAQLEELTQALEETSGRYFASFHKRYLPFNRDIYEDLRVAPGEPVSCHCVVYEIPVPPLHWYNWPNSGSRIVSNGCHWIDHFLFLNQFSRPIAQGVWVSTDGTVVATLELDNGASFSMALTDVGSVRIGVQEHVEFRANGATAIIENSARYYAESSRAVLRRRRINKLHAYSQMYREISRRIVKGEPGDSLQSVRVSTLAMLDLEEEVQRVQNRFLERAHV